MAKASAKKATEKPVEEAKALAVVPEQGRAVQVVPQHNNVGLEDMKRPLLKLVQAISPEVEELGISAGQFFATVLNMELGKEIMVTALGVKHEFILWNPQRGVEPMILARSSNGVTWDADGANKEFNVKIPNVGQVKWSTKEDVASSGLHLFGSSVPSNKDSKPALAKTYNFLLYLHDQDILPVVISLSRSKLDAARALNTIFYSSSLDARSLRAKMKVVTRQKDGQDFFNIVPMRAGKNDEDTYLRMVDYSERFTDFTADVDTDENRGGARGSRVDPANSEY